MKYVIYVINMYVCNICNKQKIRISKWYSELGQSRQFKPIYFFQRKDFAPTKTHVTPRSLCTREKLLSLLFSVSSFLLCQLIFTGKSFCVREKFSLKKKNKQTSIVLIAPIHYTTDVYPYQPTYREFIFIFICFHLFSSVKIYFFNSLRK